LALFIATTVALVIAETGPAPLFAPIVFVFCLD
jgi:hypothetical protein